MTLNQMLAFGVLAGMMILFIWGRIRYDLVAIIALLVSVLIGIVPADKAFSGQRRPACCHRAPHSIEPWPRC